MPPILGFCGASNSGKTTLVSRVISQLCGQGFRVGAIKHHGHGAPLPDPGRNKDSGRLAQAGAGRVALVHSGGIVLTADQTEAQASPPEIAAQFMTNLDLVLVEGYKTADIDKIEVVAPDKQPVWPRGGRLLALALRGGRASAGQIDFSARPAWMDDAKDGEPLILDANDPAQMADFVLSHLGLYKP